MKTNKQVFFVLIGVLVLSTLASAPLLFPLPGGEKSGRIRVMTYNLHQYYVEDSDKLSEKTGKYVFEELLKVMKGVNADIIGLQESEGLRLSSGNQNGVQWLAQNLGMYYYYGPSTSSQIYGDAILSRWPIKEKEWKLMPRPEGIERAAVRVVIDSPYGELNVFNTHFEIETFLEAQRAQANFIVDYVGSSKAIFLGDFNAFATSENEVFSIMNATFTFALQESGGSITSPDSYTFSAASPEDKIDYIWLTKGDWNVVSGSYQTIGNPQASDHLGIIVDIQM